jgi:Uma2 family endonuclease
MAIRRPQAAPEEPLPVSRYHGRRMSEAEYLALPEEKPYLEYVDGVVLQKPMPDHIHRRLIRLFDFLFETYIRAHGGDGGPEGRVRLADGSGYRLPDTAYWAPGRVSGKDSAPSLAVEVRSSDQSMADLRRKCRAFRANGVDCCWLIDPYRRTVEVFEGGRDGERLAADQPLETAVMPGFSVTQAELWAAMER